jgi:hypothetical protein
MHHIPAAHPQASRLIDPGAQGFDAGSINQKHETHEEKPEITPGHNQSPRSENHGQSKNR